MGMRGTKLPDGDHPHGTVKEHLTSRQGVSRSSTSLIQFQPVNSEVRLSLRLLRKHLYDKGPGRGASRPCTFPLELQSFKLAAASVAGHMI